TAFFVFRTFNTARQRGDSTGDDSLHQFGWRAEGRLNFARIENAEPPTRARTDVKQPASSAQRLRDDFNCPRKIGNGAVQRLLHEFLLLDKKLDQLARVHFLQ